MSGRQPVLDGDTLPLKEHVHILVVLLDSTLSLEAQVASVAKGYLCPGLAESPTMAFLNRDYQSSRSWFTRLSALCITVIHFRLLLKMVWMLKLM